MSAKMVRVLTKDLMEINQTPVAQYNPDSSYVFSFCHRIDLWDEFFRLATSSALPGQPATVLWNCGVAHADVETGTVHLSEGRSIESDLLIGTSFVRHYRVQS